MADRICRWGILGTANIARKNWQSILNAENSTLTAVASRTTERATQFIRECQAEAPFATVPEAIGSYEALLSHPQVDAVYIPLPTGLRKDWVIRAAQAGKHVLCEKPCADNATDLAEMIEACRMHNVQFMDGVMFMHSRRMESLRAALDDGESIGRIRRICSQFSFCGPDEFFAGNIRTSSALESLGCLGDLGWYTIRFALWTMKYQMPQRVTGRLLATAGRPDSPTSVPVEFSGELLFADGVSASFYNSFQTWNQQIAHVSGSKGSLLLHDFVLPYFGGESAFDVFNATMDISNCQYNMVEHTRRVSVREYSNNKPDAQETNLFRNFSTLVLSGRLDPHWPEIALKTQQVMDACLESARNGSREVTL